MLAEKLIQNGKLSKEEYCKLLQTVTLDERNLLKEAADKIRHHQYGNQVFIRGLIEFSNYCKNNCYYCGIRAGNQHCRRYRLTPEQILECCEQGYQTGFRTFVLQGGEDEFFTSGYMADIIYKIKHRFPDCAITLSAGERPKETYKKWKEAGADRYLLRHETADSGHYSKLHPKELGFSARKRCLYDLKELGFQVGAGFMVGSPYQTEECIAKDLCFLEELQPHMVGIGPFLPHHDTPFKNEKKGSYETTLLLISIVRILLPKALLPATTALGTIEKNGREQGILHGANVVMPNLSPKEFRKQYALYDNKIFSGEEAAECRSKLEQQMQRIGYEVVTARGDFPCTDN